MFLSTFDIFKIGIGPSSSHTMGPMVAAQRFIASLNDENVSAARIRATLHGSLAFTGKGHATDRAVILGLSGFKPESYDRHAAARELDRITSEKTVRLVGYGTVGFDPLHDVVFDYDNVLPRHPNSLTLEALGADGRIHFCQQYYSIGGGFVVTEAEFSSMGVAAPTVSDVPYPFASAEELLKNCTVAGLTISDLMLANECALRSEEEVLARIDNIWSTMQKCVARGLETEGILPGGLNVRRRAKALHEKLSDQQTGNRNLSESRTDWVMMYAMAVNEENAAGGQVVTAPTNGASGVIPSVILYWQRHMQEMPRGTVADFILTAAAIGSLIKRNASISGAECGCQAEVGSAAAMAAGGLAAVRGGTLQQIENAAEIALEHHLGMTCDPVKGLVQVPCIERNGLGAVKALAACSLALHGDGQHLVHLDDVIRTMWQTGRDMHASYKETSLGGLAVNVPNC